MGTREAQSFFGISPPGLLLAQIHRKAGKQNQAERVFGRDAGVGESLPRRVGQGLRLAKTAQ